MTTSQVTPNAVRTVNPAKCAFGIQRGPHTKSDLSVR